MHIAEEAARKFFSFIQNDQISWPDLDGTLIGHIITWLNHEGPQAVNGSFEVYTQTVLVIIDEWRKDPSLLDYRQVRTDGKLWVRKRRPSCIFDDEDHRRGWVLDQSWFNSIMSGYRCRQRSLAPTA